ncbi:hypothetical protein GJ496_011578 [Pomphorhynchus laevis]|nr:hypothetical protein GJ496_011578 [Pomphorhynchus laevis]
MPTFCLQETLETAANRICKLLSLNKDTDFLIHSYNTLSEQLLNWISDKLSEFEEVSKPSHSLSESQLKLQKFRLYRTTERLNKIAEKAKIETQYRTLQARMRLNNKPAFVPPEGRTLQNISNAWKLLESAERSHENGLLKELRRLQRLDHLMKKFKTKCDAHDEWANEKEQLLKNDQTYKAISIQDIKHEAFQSDLVAHQDRVEQINAIAQELNTLEHQNVTAINEKCQQICSNWNSLSDMTQAHEGRLRCLDNAQITARHRCISDNYLIPDTGKPWLIAQNPRKQNEGGREQCNDKLCRTEQRIVKS